MRLLIAGDSRDEHVSIIKKRVKIGDFSFTTPTKSTKYSNRESYSRETKRVNEITRQITPNNLENFYAGEDHAQRFAKGVKKQFLEDCLNIPILNLMSNQLPSGPHTKILGHVLYSSSEKVICLPTVKKSAYCVPGVTSGGNQKQVLNDDSFKHYIDFQKTIIDEIKISNSKEILGIVPFAASRFTSKLLNMYFENDVSHFVIDGNSSNLITGEVNLRSILSTINDNAKQRGSSLSQTYLHAINLGTNHFTADTIPADDFLNFFTYIDVVGTNTKQKFFQKKPGYPTTEPKKKVFIREKYSYDLAHTLPNSQPYVEFKKSDAVPKIKKYNEQQQYFEAKEVNSNVGRLDMKKHLEAKKGLTEITWKRLNSIFEAIKLT